MSFKTLAINAAWSISTHVLGRGSLVIAAILLARSFDTSAFAAYSYFQLTVSMLAAYAALGLGVTASRFFAETGHVKDEEMPPIGTLWLLSSVVGLVFAVVILLLPSNWLNSSLDIPRWLLALGVLVMTLDVIPSGGILGLERYAFATLAAGTSALVMIIGAIVASQKGSAHIAMVVFVIASLIQTIGNTVIVLKDVGWRRLLQSAQMRQQDLKRVASFAGPMLGVSLLSASGSWFTGRIILSGPSGEHGFALYTIGLQWYALALFIPGMISRVLLPRIVRSRLGSSANDSRILVRNGTFITLFSAMTVSFTGFLFSPWILQLYGSSYQVDRWLLGTFLIAAIPSAPVNTIGNAIVAADGQTIWFLLTFCWLVVMFITAKALQQQGALAGACALGLSSLGMATLSIVVAKRRGLI